MRKLVPVLMCLLLLLGVAAFSYAADKGMTGYIVDDKCGAKGAHEGAEACTKKCLEAGAKPVFVADKDKKVLNLDNPDAIKGHEGHHVRVTGKVTGDTLHVDNLTMVASKGNSAEHAH